MNLKSLVLIALLCCGMSIEADYRDGTEALKTKDYATAAKEFKSQAQLGYAKATFQFATMLKKAQTTDEYTSAAWFALAEAQGDKKAAREVKRVVRGLDTTQLASHNAQSEELISAYGPQAIAATLLPSTSGVRTSPNLPIFQEERAPRRLGGNFAFIGNQVLDFEYDIDAYGQPRDFQLMRKATKKYIEHATDDIRARRHQNGIGYSARIVYVRDKNVPEQYGDARLLRKLKKRAETGSPYRKYYYAHAQELAESLGHELSELDSNQWYLAAAQGGYAKAQYVLGRRLLLGADFDTDDGKGIRWLKLASENGDRYASYLLANIFRLLKEADQSSLYLAQASDQGHSTAQLRMAQRHASKGDTATALELLNKAAEHLDRVTWHYTAAIIAHYQGDTAAVARHRAHVNDWLTEYGFGQDVLTDLDAELAQGT